jgi:hypothetical protein
MSEEVFSVDGVCTVRWDGRTDAVVVEWADDVGGEAYRDCMERVLDTIVARDATKLLTDSQKQGLMAEEDQVWTADDWEPRAVEAGLQYVAVVYPTDRSAKTTVDMSARMRPHTELERVFTDDIEEARNWLRTK